MSTEGDSGHEETLPASGSEIERFCPTCEQSYPDGSQHCPEDGTRLVRLAAVKDPMVGQTIDGRFIIEERIGAGGMGAVYRARQTSVGRAVAIKVIEQKVGRDLTATKRFLREAKLASQLSQPNTVHVIDFGQTEEGMLFLAMELIKGKTLGQVLKDDGVFSPKRIARVGTQLCDALEAANGLSIIHRDLKPSNIIILDDPPGRDLLKVLDFGLAKSLTGDMHTTVTKSDVLLGTPLYISPEVVTGAGEDHRTDLYSVGVILYELATGKPPFFTDNVNILVAQHAYDAPPDLPKHVPRALGDVIIKLLQKEPDDRYQSAAKLRDALAVALTQSGSQVVRPPAAVVDTADAASRKEALAHTLADPASTDHSLAVAAAAADTEPSRKGPMLGLLALLLVGAGAFALYASGIFTSDTEQSEPAEVEAPVEPAPSNVPATVTPETPAAVPAASPPDAGVPDAAPVAKKKKTSKRRTRAKRPPLTKQPPELKKPPELTKPPEKKKPRIDYRLPD